MSAKALNEDLQWSDVAAKYPNDARAFRGVPAFRYLPPGTAIYRFYSSGGNMLSKWWLSEQVWRTFNECAKNGVSVSDWARSRLAVSLDWSPAMDRVVRGTVTTYAPHGKPGIWVFAGAPAHQPLVRGSNVLLIGDKLRAIDSHARFEQLLVLNVTERIGATTSPYLNTVPVRIPKGRMTAAALMSK